MTAALLTISLRVAGVAPSVAAATRSSSASAGEKRWTKSLRSCIRPGASGRGTWTIWSTRPGRFLTACSMRSIELVFMMNRTWSWGSQPSIWFINSPSTVGRPLWSRSWAMRSMSFEDEHGGLEVAAHAAQLARVEQALAADEADGELGEEAREVEGDGGLAGARGRVEEDAALQLNAE